MEAIALAKSATCWKFVYWQVNNKHVFHTPTTTGEPCGGPETLENITLVVLL